MCAQRCRVSCGTSPILRPIVVESRSWPRFENVRGVTLSRLRHRAVPQVRHARLYCRMLCSGQTRQKPFRILRHPEPVSPTIRCLHCGYVECCDSRPLPFGHNWSSLWNPAISRSRRENRALKRRWSHRKWRFGSSPSQTNRDTEPVESQKRQCWSPGGRPQLPFVHATDKYVAKPAIVA